jgi:cold shock protein
MATGTVKWFNTTKGFGFIAPDDGGKDVFVHISAVERAGLKGLNDNQKIAYELQSGRDGRSSASDLKLIRPRFGNNAARRWRAVAFLATIGGILPIFCQNRAPSAAFRPSPRLAGRKLVDRARRCS